MIRTTTFHHRKHLVFADQSEDTSKELIVSFEWLVETLRRPHRDRAKAHAYLIAQDSGAVHEDAAAYDAALADTSTVRSPSVLIGTASDSLGQRVPVRLALATTERHTLVLGSTGA